MKRLAVAGLLAMDESDQAEACLDYVAKRLHNRLSPDCVHDDDWDCREWSLEVIEAYLDWLADGPYVILPVNVAGQRPSTLNRTLKLMSKAGFKDAVLTEIEDLVDLLVGLGWDSQVPASAFVKSLMTKEVN